MDKELLSEEAFDLCDEQSWELEIRRIEFQYTAEKEVRDRKERLDREEREKKERLEKEERDRKERHGESQIGERRERKTR